MRFSPASFAGHIKQFAAHTVISGHLFLALYVIYFTWFLNGLLSLLQEESFLVANLFPAVFRSVTVIVICHKSSGRNYLVNNNRNSKLRIKDDTAPASRFVWLSPEFLCYDGPGSSSTVHLLLNETPQTSALFNAVLESELIDVMSAPCRSSLTHSRSTVPAEQINNFSTRWRRPITAKREYIG